MSPSGFPLSYTYTNNDQLTGVTHTNSSFSSQSFTWDENGNETGTGYTTSSDNEQTASPGYTYAYDSDGNMTTMTQTSTGDVWTYTYNYRNQMTGATEKSSTGTVLSQTTYTYDGLGNRIGIDENGTQTWTLFDGSSPVMDFNSSGSLTMRYLNGPIGDLVDAVLARQSSGGTVAWYLPDRLGTVRDLMSTSGSIIDHVDYGAFGNQLDESSPSNGDRMMGFAGLVRDTTTSLNLAVRRSDQPLTGRWTSLDPKGFAALDENLYRYVGNSPTNASDSQGEFGFVGGLIGGGVGLVIGGATGAIGGAFTGGLSGAVSGGIGGAIGGAVTGGLIGSGAGLVVVAVGGFAGNTIGSVAGQLATGQDPLDLCNAASSLVSGTVGAVTGPAGQLVGRAVSSGATGVASKQLTGLLIGEASASGTSGIVDGILSNGGGTIGGGICNAVRNLAKKARDRNKLLE